MDKVEIKVEDNGNGIPQKILWIKYFNHSLQQNQQGREQDWDYRLAMILLKHMVVK